MSECKGEKNENKQTNKQTSKKNNKNIIQCQRVEVLPFA